ncbi:hypothetical protein [Streptococcus oricebi]|uniref:Uncharacterized protein n=1 Tax=Streptococcus oricebi TaxID=1547447 RepID=A0ABS5B550_9STRE|nr:hypothetical protein [Streptococcus oricebi]MBP2623963.1 hypothetical protein [Streptococcus oricebi]
MTKDKKFLLLFFNDPRNKNIFLDHLNQEENVQAVCVLKPVNVILRIIRKIHLLSGWPGIEIWFLPWKKDLAAYDYIVSIASPYSPRILDWISKKLNKKVGLINYYWDSMEVSAYPFVNSDKFQNWTFFKEDSLKYKMRYNPQFYIEKNLLSQEEIKYDVTYVGADRQGKLKKRTALVLETYDLLGKYKISSYFHYLSKNPSLPKEIQKDFLLTEEEYYRISAQGRAVLELIEPNIPWVTLRPLFALSNQKKVITNNPRIADEKYYSKENIFILGQDKPEDLAAFIRSDFSPISAEKLSYYNATAWLQRFLEKEEK